MPSEGFIASHGMRLAPYEVLTLIPDLNRNRTGSKRQAISDEAKHYQGTYIRGNHLDV